MKKISLLLAGLFLAVGLVAQNCGPYRFRNFSIADSASLDVIGGDTFILVSKYPQQIPDYSNMPWDKLDFKKKQSSYMDAVLGYCLEGNVEVDFKSHLNEVRSWYHAPWMDYGYAGREPMHGLVMDRTAYAEDFLSNDKGKARNYSITYYNDIAAYTLGNVWCKPNEPDPTKAVFSEGAVFFTMVFTTADSSLFPFLSQPFKWEALVEQKTMVPIDEKRVDEVRLFEVNFGVKTSKSPTGWVMGSFIYNGEAGEDLQSRLVPVCLQWGNDPGATPSAVRKGEAQLTESWFNTDVYTTDSALSAGNLIKKTGFAGRAQRPLGSIEGSLLSEAMFATFPAGPILPPANIDMDSTMKYFDNLPAGESLSGAQSLDFSLELRAGLRNHAIANGDSTLIQEVNRELEEAFGFYPPEKTNKAEEEEEVIEYDQGLEGQNLYTFIGFIVLVLVIGALLVLNILRK